MDSNSASLVRQKGEAVTLSQKQKTQLEATFGRHINKGQVKYLKAGHLDVIETQRQGIRFVDPVSGKSYIDCFSSAGSFNVGRHNQIICKALEQALGELDMGSCHLVSPYRVNLARKLVELAPSKIDRVFFAAGGGDAVDGAIKLARGATGKTDIISTVKGYHGHTGFALSANGKEHYREYFEPLIPGFKFAPFNDFEAIKKLASEKTAAIIIEPIQGEAGIFVADTEYMRSLRKLCDKMEICLIFDEIQTGFGRTGKMFACEHYDVQPDIMTVAKSIGGGLFPNAAVLYRGGGKLSEFVESHPDFHPTYTGGSDLGCLVSQKVIEYLVDNKVYENAEKMGARLYDALVELMNENPKIIKEVRGKGLMIGIEYIHEFMGPMMSDALAKNGMFAAYSGNAPQVMRFMLPIVVTDQEMDAVIEAIQKAVKAMKILLPLALPAAKIPSVLKLLNNEKGQMILFGFLRKVEDFFSMGTDALKKVLK